MSGMTTAAAALTYRHRSLPPISVPLPLLPRYSPAATCCYLLPTCIVVFNLCRLIVCVDRSGCTRRVRSNRGKLVHPDFLQHIEEDGRWERNAQKNSVRLDWWYVLCTGTHPYPPTHTCTRTDTRTPARNHATMHAHAVREKREERRERRSAATSNG